MDARSHLDWVSLGNDKFMVDKPVAVNYRYVVIIRDKLILGYVIIFDYDETHIVNVSLLSGNISIISVYINACLFLTYIPCMYCA